MANEALNRWMKEQGITSKELAESIGRSKSAIDGYRRGVKYPSRVTRVRMRKLGIPVDKIFEEEE